MLNPDAHVIGTGLVDKRVNHDERKTLSMLKIGVDPSSYCFLVVTVYNSLRICCIAAAWKIEVISYRTYNLLIYFHEMNQEICRNDCGTLC
jgi:hypothetical protein